MKPWIFYLVVGLIIYGSLYPFNFAIPHGHIEAWTKLFSNWSLLLSRMDAFGNLLLFIPFGFAGIVATAVWSTSSARITLTSILGFALALILQLAQIYVPERTPALSDVLWNMIGLGIGIAIAFSVRQSTHRLPSDHTIPLGMIAFWVVAELLPFVPSLDVQSIRSNLKGILNPAMAYDQLLFHAAGSLMAGRALATVVGDARTLRWLLLLTGMVAMGKVFVVTLTLNVSTLAGLAIGIATWWYIGAWREPRRTTLVLLFLFAAYAFGALTPFQFGSSPESFSWMPFAGLLRGSMLVNIQALAANLSLYAGMLWTISAMGGRLSATSFALAGLVLIFETVQIYIVGRTPDITEPLLILILGQILRAALSTVPQRRNSPTQIRTSTKTTAPLRAPIVPSVPARSFNAMRWGLGVGIICLAMAFAFSRILRLPQLPYNVVELFLENGSFPSLMIFALALLWIGAGARLAGYYVAISKHAWLALPLLTFGAGIISLQLLKSSVTGESIADVIGSTNLHNCASNLLVWDKWAQDVFALLPFEIACSFERPVRYAALYGPVVTCLALMFIAANNLTSARTPPKNTGLLLISTFLWLWMCKVVTFDWASTDNLTELIAINGPASIGGGSYLYLLLAVICANAVLLSNIRFTFILVALATGVTFAAVPIGWWLLNNGLEQHVQKYESVFSGVQFLLGPDRKQILPQEVLFARWSAVQLSGVLLIAVGAKIIQPVVDWLPKTQTVSQKATIRFDQRKNKIDQ